MEAVARVFAHADGVKKLGPNSTLRVKGRRLLDGLMAEVREIEGRLPRIPGREVQPFAMWLEAREGHRGG